MDVKCPACGSEEIRRVSLLWKEIAQGTFPASDVLAAVMVGSHPRAHAAGAQSEQRQQQLLVEELAPPRKLADPPAAGSCREMATRMLLLLGGVALLVLGSLRLIAARPRAGQLLATLLGAVALALVLYLLVRFVAPKPTFREYERRVVAWDCMFLCVRCGNRFCQDV